MSAPIFCERCSRAVTPELDGDGRAPCPGCGELLAAPVSADVFISYAREDLARAKEVAGTLASAGISSWRDAERIRPGASFVQEIAAGLVVAKVVVLVLSRHAVGSPWVELEITDAKGRGLPILPLLVENFELPRPWRLLLAHHQWDDPADRPLTTRVGRLVEAVKAALLKAAAVAPAEPDVAATRIPDAPALAGVDPRISPYVGPRPFGARMADRFFGRQRDAEALLRVLARARAVLVYAPSGAGKTSLLSTLIAQGLDDQGTDVLLNARVGGAVPPDVSAEDIRNIFTFSAIGGLEPAAPPHPKWRLVDYLRTIQRKPGTRGRVVVFDQFEELFTQHRERFEDRVGFFDDVVEALHDDATLRVVFASRQEFLADIDPFVEAFPPDLQVQRFALKRLGPDGALEAIVRPAERYAEFAPGVAETIVEQLNTIRVTRFDGTVVEKAGEFIEMVHLQIVCERLWSRLPPGLTRIELRHVEEAAGEGRTIREFIANALDAFYEETIARVVKSAATLRHGQGHYSEALIRLGCMKFITPAATRTMVQRANGRTGRLPDWIVDQLENSHLLRSEQRGGERWYELSHDRLAEPVGRQMDREVSALLFAADLLSKVLEKTVQEHGSLAGYFGEHRDVLADCRPFHGQAGLFPDEAEFVFRASLTAGQDMREWSRRLAEDFPQVRVAVLREALSSGTATVRRNAAVLLGTDPAEDLMDGLVALAIGDPEPSVRRAAALGLARTERPELYGALSAGRGDTATAAGALEALARIRIAADSAVPRPAFEAHFAVLARADRWRIRRRAWAVRFHEGLAVLPFVFVPAASFAAVTAASFKWLPASFNWAVSQHEASAGMGVFHGMVAGVVWAGLITLAIATYHLVFGREHGRRSLVKPLAALLAGAIGGFLGSAALVSIILSVYDGASLHTMGWLASRDLVRFSSEFLRDVFVTGRFGWLYLITGTGLGVGMALATNSVRASAEWRALMAQDGTGVAGLQEASRLTRRIMRLVLPRAWPLPVAVAVASLIAFVVPALTEAGGAELMVSAAGTKANSRDLVLGLLGDGATQVIGAYFGICGMGLGLVVMRRGLEFEPRRNLA